ncbi:MAG TPA: SRPBCC family protein, partial [Pseudonocardia sp.]|nr:SRPBCC family protein [Pseudonocardia sp.]
PEGSGTRLREWMQMGPGRSGLSFAIDRMPEKEQKIVFVRMREFEANMSATLAAIKERVESATAPSSVSGV